MGLTSEESLRTWGYFPGGPVAKTLHSQCRGLGSVPGQGTRSHVLQLRIHTLQQKILCGLTKTEDSTSRKAAKPVIYSHRDSTREPAGPTTEAGGPRACLQQGEPHTP